MSASGTTRSSPRSDRPDFAARLQGEAVLVVSGELDLATRPRLTRSVRELLALLPDRRLIVDLAGVTFLDASALGVFVRARNACRNAGGDLVVRSPSTIVQRLLTIVGLTDLVEAAPPSDGVEQRLAAWPGLTEVATAWQEACLMPRYGAAPLVFDPVKMMTTIAALLDDGEVRVGSACSAETEAAVSMEPGTSPVVAVLQLWALNEVLHNCAAVGRHDDLGSAGALGRRPGLEAPLAGVAATVLSQFERASLVDPLTGLLNRSAMERDLLEAIAVARRRRQTLTVVVVDVDGLKSTNDEFGHAAGDVVLRGIAACLASAVRTGDNVYRIGGDEFVLVLPDLSPDDVETVMRRTLVGAPSPFSWGCAGTAVDDVGERDDLRAARLVDLADRRMLERRAEIRRRRESGRNGHPGSTPAPAPARPEPRGIASSQVAAGYRARVVIDGARGIIAEDFGVSIDDAAAILDLVASARHETPLAVAEGLVGRSPAEAAMPVSSGLSAPQGEVPAPTADDAVSSVED